MRSGFEAGPAASRHPEVKGFEGDNDGVRIEDLEVTV